MRQLFYSGVFKLSGETIMNINSISTNNVNRSQNYSNKNLAQKQSFTSIMPVKVFIDGSPSVDSLNVKRAIRALSEILFQPAKDNQAAKKIKQVFSLHDRDFRHIDGSGDKSEVLRNRPFNGLSYIFTGKQAEQLDGIGRKIGPAKGRGLDDFGTTKTFEAKALAKEYFEQIEKFISSNSKAKIREKINPETGAYEGNELGLCILTKSQGKPGKKGFKLTVDDIVFRKIQKDVPKVATTTVSKPVSAKPTPVKPVPAESVLSQPTTTKPKARSRKTQNADWPAMPPKREVGSDELDFGDNR